MEVNEVRVAEDKDFDILKIYLERNDGWKKEYEKKSLSVWTRSTIQDSEFKMLRVKAEMSDIPASVLFDVLHDPFYRKTWDKHMIEYRNIEHINPNNDIGYYALSCPSPMKNRDFVIQSSWLQTPKEYMIINHSVSHKDCPSRHGFIRGISYLTGFVVKPKENGCTLGYVTHCNPKGHFPTWISNKLSTTLAPKLIKRLHKACVQYNHWKNKNNPGLKPWLNPEQIKSKKIVLEDCVPEENDDESSDNSPEESLADIEFNGYESDDQDT